VTNAQKTMKGNPKCEKCKGEGTIREKDGTIHICYKCLQDGSMDQHEKKIRDAKDFGLRM
jgi:hypothetical protein